jgi:diguanylate cyclase (GGDEF)-like protein/PAS domain S-box-containing protein
MTPIVLLLVLASALLAARRMHLRATHAARSDLQTIFDTAPIGNLVLDERERVVDANAALGRLAGIPARELVGRPLSQLVSGEDLALLRIGFAQLRHAVIGELSTEVQLRAGSGCPLAASVHAALLAGRGARASAPRLLVQVLDITERKRVEAQLKHLAEHDPLTGLLNRRRFESELSRHVAQARRYGAEGAVIVLDVDHFKQVNDTCGHGAGDRLIAQVAAALRARLRGTDVIARVGGDEFAILLPKADRTGAEVVAASLVETIRTRADAHADPLAPSITISVGVAMVRADAAGGADELVAAADLAMYAAKEAGRDGYAFAGARAQRPAVSVT